jgi:hypothetical protein
MQITIELPEDIAVGLQSKWKDRAPLPLHSFGGSFFSRRRCRSTPF